MSENRFAAPWNIFSNNKFNLTGEQWKDAKGRPNLKYRVVNNNPRFLVYMNDDKVQKPIPFALDPIIIQEVFQVVRHVVATKEPTRFAFELKSSYDHRGGRTEKPAPVSKIFIGRDSEGVCYIAFQAKGEQLAKFSFTPSYYADLISATGEKVEKELASEIRAIAWVNALDSITGAFMVVHGKEPENKPGSGGGYDNKKKTGDWGKPKASDSWDADGDADI